MKNLSTKQRIATFLVIAVIIFMASCAQKPDIELVFDTEQYGFWSGLLHGFILPFSFIGSLFNDDIAIYALNNTGGWYNFGFVFGASCIFGGTGKGASRKK